MNTEWLVNRIRYDINNSFALVDTWFDESNCVLNFQPASTGWTNFQILEHVMITNLYLLKLIKRGTAKAVKKALIAQPVVDWNTYSLNRKELTDIGEHRSFKWNRPEHMAPQNNISLSDIRTRIKEQRNECLEYLSKLKNGEGFLHKTTMTVNNLGKLDVYEYIEFLTLHMCRHMTQMERNKREFLSWKMNMYAA